MKKLIDKIKRIRQKNKEKMQDINYVTKLFKRSQTELLIAVLVCLGLYFFNYSYTMLKVKVVTDYLYTDTLEGMARNHLNESLSLRNFDYLTIALYSESLEKEDKYFKLFKAGEYGEELREMRAAKDRTTVRKTENGTGVISFDLFAGSAIRKIKKEADVIKDCDKIIIDLRNNPGGLVNSAKSLSNMFLDGGKVIYTAENRRGEKTVKSSGKAVLKPKKIIILQNGGTASAAELFIMSLKENLDNVTVIGEQSYGKGIGQSEFMLPDRYAFKYTSVRMKTPSGGSINGVGITPDIEYTGDDIMAFAEEQ